MTSRTWLPRLLGVATAAYGAATLARPDWFLVPAGLIKDRSEIGNAMAMASRAVATRDVACGLAMAGAPDDRALRTAIAVRVGSDAGDAVLLALALRGKPTRAKAVGVAAGWGVLCALSALTTRKR